MKICLQNDLNIRCSKNIKRIHIHIPAKQNMATFSFDVDNRNINIMHIMQIMQGMRVAMSDDFLIQGNSRKQWQYACKKV